MLSDMCHACILKQAESTMNLFNISDTALRNEITGKVNDSLISKKSEINGPVFSLMMRDILYCYTKISDPYSEIKKKNLSEAEKYIPLLAAMIADAEDRLMTAMRVAITGNIIDMGASPDFSINDELSKITTGINMEEYPVFLKEYTDAKSILYIADNFEEALFDKLLLKEMSGKDIVFATRKGNILNDISFEDAIELGIHNICPVIESGSRIAGTDMNSVTPQFTDLFYSSDMVISKGQGNLETLIDTDREVWFLFKVKCKNIADLSQHPVGSGALFSNRQILNKHYKE